jgi:hypothetical protein
MTTMTEILRLQAMEAERDTANAAFVDSLRSSSHCGDPTTVLAG